MNPVARCAITRGLIRLGIVAEPEWARSMAEAVVRAATATKDNPADLINVALEEGGCLGSRPSPSDLIPSGVCRRRFLASGVLLGGVVLLDLERCQLVFFLGVGRVDGSPMSAQLAPAVRGGGGRFSAAENN